MIYPKFEQQPFAGGWVPRLMRSYLAPSLLAAAGEPRISIDSLTAITYGGHGIMKNLTSGG